MESKSPFGENFSSLVIFLIIFLALGIIFPIARSALPDTAILNNRATIAGLANAVAAISMIIILVMAFLPLREVIRVLISSYIQDQDPDIHKAANGLLVFVYTFPVFYLLASRTDMEAGTNGIPGAPFLVLNQISDFSLQWLYGLAIWAAWIWGTGTFINFSLKAYPLIKLYTDQLGEQVENKVSAQKDKEETKNS